MAPAISSDTSFRTDLLRERTESVRTSTSRKSIVPSERSRPPEGRSCGSHSRWGTSGSPPSGTRAPISSGSGSAGPECRDFVRGDCAGTLDPTSRGPSRGRPPSVMFDPPPRPGFGDPGRGDRCGSCGSAEPPFLNDGGPRDHSRIRSLRSERPRRGGGRLSERTSVRVQSAPPERSSSLASESSDFDPRGCRDACEALLPERLRVRDFRAGCVEVGGAEPDEGADRRGPRPKK